MQQLEVPCPKGVRPEPIDSQSELPEGSQIQHVAFVTDNRAAREILLEFPEPRRCRAILTSGPNASPSAAADGTTELTLLLTPSGEHDVPELLTTIWNWVEPEVPHDRRQGFLITLHGARVVWTPGRAAIIAPAERLDLLRLALVEFAFHDGEIRQIEQAIAKTWPELEADAPLAFQFDEKTAPRREQLGERFQQILGLRARLARINPVVHRPPIHPPTLAGQLGERLKERTRLAERIEYLSGQVEVVERVYEMCAERASEYVHSKKETTLEWVIIVLLATETIILLIDLMARLGK